MVSTWRIGRFFRNKPRSQQVATQTSASSPQRLSSKIRASLRLAPGPAAKTDSRESAVPTTVNKPTQVSANVSEAANWIAQFHLQAGLCCHRLPTADVPEEVASLRTSLLREEVDEFATAAKNHDIVGIADALADILYVTYGAAITYGIDLDDVLAEVHRSNMTKLSAELPPKLREDGKVLKTEGYISPDIAGVIANQSPLPWVSR
jgi:predicted HAD superfamily Cof-like phosphohydrolase